MSIPRSDSDIPSDSFPTPPLVDKSKERKVSAEENSSETVMERERILTSARTSPAVRTSSIPPSGIPEDKEAPIVAVAREVVSPSAAAAAAGKVASAKKVEGKKLPPSHPSFVSLNPKEAREKINLMKEYISKIPTSPDHEKQIASISKVLEQMEIQVELMGFEKIEFTAVLCEGSLAGLMATLHDPRTGSFYLNDMITAPWNVVPSPPIRQSNGKIFTPPPARSGIGPLLMGQAFHKASEAGVDKLRLMSLDKESNDFYLKQGFIATGKPGVFPCPMEKIVPPPSDDDLGGTACIIS